MGRCPSPFDFQTIRVSSAGARPAAQASASRGRSAAGEEDDERGDEERVGRLDPDRDPRERACEERPVDASGVDRAERRPHRREHRGDRRQVGHVGETRPVRREKELLERRAVAVARREHHQERPERPDRRRDRRVGTAVELVGDSPDEDEDERHENQRLQRHDHRQAVQERGAGDERHPAVEDRQPVGDHRLRDETVRDRPLRRPVLGCVAAAVPDPAVVGRVECEPGDGRELDDGECQEQRHGTHREVSEASESAPRKIRDCACARLFSRYQRPCVRGRRAASCARGSRRALRRVRRRAAGAAARSASTCPTRSRPSNPVRSAIVSASSRIESRLPCRG